MNDVNNQNITLLASQLIFHNFLFCIKAKKDARKMKTLKVKESPAKMNRENVRMEKYKSYKASERSMCGKKTDRELHEYRFVYLTITFSRCKEYDLHLIIKFDDYREWKCIAWNHGNIRMVRGEGDLGKRLGTREAENGNY